MVIFQDLINELLEAGWTQKELAEAAGCGQPNIARLLKDPACEPRYNVGAELVALHDEL